MANSVSASNKCSNMNDYVNMAIDIGGSLIKFVYIIYLNNEKYTKNSALVINFVNKLNEISVNRIKNTYQFNKKNKICPYFNNCENVEIYFYIFERTKKTVDFLTNLINDYSQYIFDSNHSKILFTGSCASLLQNELNKRLIGKVKSIDIIKLEYLATYGGIKILQSLSDYNNHAEWYTYEKKSNSAVQGESSEQSKYENYVKTSIDSIDDQFILLYIGTGTSILHIEHDKITYLQHFNISGGTFFGLCKLLCNFSTYDETIRATINGNNKVIDYTMSDMIEGNKDMLNEIKDTMKEYNVTETGTKDMAPDLDFIVNSFGKSCIIKNDSNNNNTNVIDTFNKNDLANAVLLMVINSCTLNACQFAKRFNCKQIVYAGSFLFKNSYAKYKAAKLTRYLSNDHIKAVFTDKESFINAIGCLYDSRFNNIKFESLM